VAHGRLEDVTAAPAPDLDRRAAAIVVAVAGVMLVGLALWLVPWDWVPGGDLRPMRAQDLFTPDEIARAEEFAGRRRLLSWSSYAVSLALALGLGLTSYGARLLRRTTGRLPWWLAVPAGTLLLLALGRVVTLPFALLLRRQSLEYDLTRQDLAGWSTDQVKGLLVAWVMTALLLLVLVGTARRSPRHWFAWAGGVVVLLTLLGSFLYPVVVEPLFNKFTSMPDGLQRTAILELADREEVEVEDVLVADASRRTTTLNAYVSGLGSTRRVVVYDTLLEQMTPREVEAVVAHELAHAKNHDVLVGTSLGAVAGVGGVATLALLLDGRLLRRSGAMGPGDPAVVALVLALSSVATFVSSPAVNSVSRAIEARADRESLAATGASEVFIDMQRRLAIRAVSDPTPPWWSQFWFGSHPTVLQRAGLPSSLSEAGR
jgi:STE24 endopeptidase